MAVLRIMGRRLARRDVGFRKTIQLMNHHARSRVVLICGLLLLSVGTAGCQVQQSVTNHQLIQHQAMIDFSGLGSPEVVPDLNITCATPVNWNLAPIQKNGLYAHAQWRSPSTYTGVGAVQIHLPLPLSEKAILWFAKKEYTKKSKDGREIAQWTDDVGRHWFEAENDQYHVQGYVIARGFSAWVVYFGYKTGYPPNLAELSVAARCMETFIPGYRPKNVAAKPAAPSVEKSVTASAR